MVVFACNACGESLKKNQVENHYLRKCRNCNVLSCLDCGKDFWGNDYEQHTKCISEEEKYSGKNFVAKPSSNKNEIKQLQWVEQVEAAVDKCGADSRLRGILVKLKGQPNIPRKKNKFLNFLANGFHVKDPGLASKVWEVLMENTETVTQKPTTNNTVDEAAVTPTSKDQSSSPTISADPDTTDQQPPPKLSKRERKEERRKESHKTEKKDKNLVAENGGNTEEKVKKKKGKRKRESDPEIPTATATEEINGSEDNSESTADTPVKKKLKRKFDWKQTILEVLQAKGSEIKIKRLKKKVLAEYLSQGCSEVSEEKLWAKFDKRLKKIPEIKITGELVKLKTDPVSEM